MPTIKLDQDLLGRMVARLGGVHDPDDVANRLPLLGCDVDRSDDSELVVEIFPDRPDLLSASTLSRALVPFLHEIETPLAPVVNDGTIRLKVDSDLKGIRPHVVAAVIRDVEFGQDADRFIKALMDHQEKLHFALGRRRKRSSIGVHDLETLTPPFHAMSASRTTEFVPLGEEAPWTVERILDEHPKGVEYAHLLDGMERIPLIVDASGEVLSFPPILNGARTTVSATTRDLLIDVTGWDRVAVETCLQLMCLQLEGWGGRIESVILETERGEEVTPCFTPRRHRVSSSLIRRTLGMNPDASTIRSALARMGGRLLEADEGGNLTVEMPAWRYDLLHPIDVVEDLAIGIGYDALGDQSPTTPLQGIPSPSSDLRRRLRSTFIGLGGQEITSLDLSSEEKEFTWMRWASIGAVTRLMNPITEHHTLLRQRVLPSLIDLMASNRHHDLPRIVFEVGRVVHDHRNRWRASLLICEADGGFARIRGITQAVMSDLQVVDWSVTPTHPDRGPWLTGRGGRIEVDGTPIGCFGEVDPRVGDRFGLRVPMAGLELDVELMLDLIPDPVRGPAGDSSGA